MNVQNFGHWFRLIVKILIPVAFFAIAAWPRSFWLAGVMTIFVLFSYILELQKIGYEFFLQYFS
jgi:energy-coupling factor transporter transmembrane protein EcfT